MNIIGALTTPVFGTGIKTLRAMHTGGGFKYTESHRLRKGGVVASREELQWLAPDFCLKWLRYRMRNCSINENRIRGSST